MLSITKMKAMYEVFETGKAVANPDALRSHQVTANMIALFLFAIVSLLKAFGYDIGIDMQTCTNLGIGVLATINAGITIAASTKHGMPARAVREAQPPVPAASEAAEQPTEIGPDVARPADEDVSHVSQAPAEQQTIDDDTRRKAIEWVRQHSVQPNRFDNGLKSDA